MNEITTLFTDIGNFFTNSNWFQMVKWPFWILLFTVAAGGVYCARFGKKTLLNQGICTTLNLAVIYLGSMIGCLYWSPLRDLARSLPFLSVTDQGASLVNPLTLDLAGVSPVLLKLMILIFMVSMAESFCMGGKTVISWFLSECATIIVARVVYAVIIAGISFIFPRLLPRYSIIPVVFFIAVGVLMICAKFIFTVVVTGGNPYFGTVYKFFTVNRGGSLLTVSALSFLLSMVLLGVLHMVDAVSLTYASANRTGLWIILAMMLVSLYIFGIFFHDKKKS